MSIGLRQAPPPALFPAGSAHVQPLRHRTHRGTPAPASHQGGGAARRGGRCQRLLRICTCSAHARGQRRRSSHVFSGTRHSEDGGRRQRPVRVFRPVAPATPPAGRRQRSPSGGARGGCPPLPSAPRRKWARGFSWAGARLICFGCSCGGCHGHDDGGRPPQRSKCWLHAIGFPARPGEHSIL